MSIPTPFICRVPQHKPTHVPPIPPGDCPLGLKKVAVTERWPWGALRDIQKNGCEGDYHQWRFNCIKFQQTGLELEQCFEVWDGEGVKNVVFVFL